MEKPTVFEQIDLRSEPQRVNSIDFRELKGKRPDLIDWDNVMERLASAHGRFYQFNPDVTVGSLQNINNYLIEAVNWIQGKAQTSNFIAIAAPANWQSLPQDSLNQFRDSWLNNFESNMVNDQTFIMFEQVNRQLRVELSKLGSIKVDEGVTKVIDDFKKDIDIIMS